MMMIDSDSPNKTNQVQKRRHPLRWVAALLILLAVGWCFLQWQLWGIQVTVTQVGVHGLPDGFEGLRIVQISDLHGHEYGQDSEALLALVAQQAPEFIVVTGDLIDQESHLAMVPALARGLAAIAPTYYVTGNHEWAVGGVPRLKGILTECGVTVLSNQYVTLERNGDSLVLAGVDDPNGYADQKTPEELYGEIQREAGDLCTILLAHRNDRFDQYAAGLRSGDLRPRPWRHRPPALYRRPAGHGPEAVPHLDGGGLYPGRQHPIRLPGIGQQYGAYSRLSPL